METNLFCYHMATVKNISIKSLVLHDQLVVVCGQTDRPFSLKNVATVGKLYNIDFLLHGFSEFPFGEFSGA